MKIYIIGFMGVGKSTIGKHIAKELGFSFIDTDSLIVNKENMKITEIFKKHGEEYFREIERQVLLDLNKEDNCVISTGGGLPLYKDNMDVILESGVSIWLSAKKETILKNLKNDFSRPILNGSNKEQVIEELLSQRSKVYCRAQYQIDVNSKSVKNIVNEIKAEIFRE